MIEPTDIKPKEMMFHFEEHLKFKGIDIPFDFYKSYKKVIGILKELHGGYYTIFGTITLLGIVYSFTQRYTNVYNNNKNINNLSLLDIKKSKFE